MPRLIAIDIGSHQVKLSTWRVAGRSVTELEERVSMPVPQGGDVPDLTARMAALDALLDEHPALAAQPADRCVLALPGELATYHRLVLPFADRAQVEKTLRFALEAEVPFDLDDMVVGWRVVKSDTRSEVLTVVSRHDRLKEWLSALASRRLDPERVYVDTELLTAVSGGPGLGAGAIAVVDVGHSHTAVAVVVDGIVRVCRTISVAGHAFTRAIQQALQCDWAEAEARKHGTWVNDAGDDEATDPGRRRSGYAQLPDEARRAMDGAIGLLLAELRSTLIRAEDDLGVELGEVRLTGGGASFRELWDYIAADLGVPVRAAAPASGEVVPVEWMLAHAAAGALQAASPKATDLRVGDLAYRGGTDLLRAGLVYGGAGTAFFALTVILVFAFQYRSLAVQQRDAEEAIRAIVSATFPEVPASLANEPGTAVMTMRELTADAVQRATLLGDGAGGVPPTIDALSRLTAAFPPHPTVTVEVRSLTITAESIQFDAETDSYASAAAIEEALKATPEFAQATKGDDTKQGSHVVFPMTIPRGEGVAEAGEEG